MPGRVELTIIADNVTSIPGLALEHGLSIQVIGDGKHILFDTGMGIVLPGNAAALSVDLSQIDDIVLSHGHYDHTGGLPHILEQSTSPRIFIHPDAMGMRYRRLQVPPHKPIGMSPAIAERLSARSFHIVSTTKPTQVTDHVWVTGTIPRRTSYEDTGGPFFVDEECHLPDPIMDDQALWINTAEGIVVILGCAHSGVVNTLDYVAELSGATHFHTIIGGMHLLNASAERLESTINALKHYRVKHIAPCHCTGDAPVSLMTKRFPAEFVRVGAGSRFAWPLCG